MCSRKLHKVDVLRSERERVSDGPPLPDNEFMTDNNLAYVKSARSQDKQREEVERSTRERERERERGLTDAT